MRRYVIAILTVVLVATLGAGPAGAAVSCHTIDATGVGQGISPPDVVPIQTVAWIQDGGLLQGTTEAAFFPTGLVGTTLGFTGPVTFTTNRATLTVDLTGTLDVLTGEFVATGPVTGATGKLHGATGALTFEGVQNLVDGSFTETVVGEICVDLAANGRR